MPPTRSRAVGINRPGAVVWPMHHQGSGNRLLLGNRRQVFNRARVEQPSRSSRVTVSTSPGPRTASTYRSCVRSVSAARHFAEDPPGCGGMKRAHLPVNALIVGRYPARISNDRVIMSLYSATTDCADVIHIGTYIASIKGRS
jgi:hypothetical protein